jgi:hypothetical protein
MVRSALGSIEMIADQAAGFMQKGRFRDAERYLRELISETHVVDTEYNHWLEQLASCYGHLRRRKEAGFVFLYLHYFDRARNAFGGDEAVAERARTLDVEKRYLDAAQLFVKARMPVHAAVAFERAEDYAEASAHWEALSKDPQLRSRPYEQALVSFNYGMSLSQLDDESNAGRRALIESQRRLEQVADDFETRGERERAFDCYQILLKLGRDSGQFENLAEGYLNCIRVLKEDNLKFYVLQYYEDFIKLALERSELHAAATLYQEAADFAARAGLPYDRHYQAQAAATWVRCAAKNERTGAPVELTENALLAAISCYSSVSNYQKVRTLFDQLGTLELPDKKRNRYGQIAHRYLNAGAGAEDLPEFPEYLKQQHAYADIWFVDLLEWELGGNPYHVAASIIGDRRYPNGIRRRALVVVLTMADAESRNQANDAETLCQVAELLGELQAYAALSPLEKLYDSEDPQVRRAAIRALRFLFFKRSFVLIRKALVDPDPGVRDAARDALGNLHFPHAFNSLARIYRESSDASVQAVALESIGKIQNLEAGEFLLSVMRQEEGELQQVARRALAQLDNADVLPILRQYYQIETNPGVRDALEGLLRSHRGL